MPSVLVLTYWSFKDALVQSYTLPYVKIIARVSNKKIFLVCMEQGKLATTTQERKDINEQLASSNIEVIFLQYNRFGIRQIISLCFYIAKLVYTIIFKKVSYIHCWCTPAGALGYILSVITGKKLILDSYEPHAELMLETKTWQPSSMAYKILFTLERYQTIKASHIIGVVPEMIDYALKKYGVKIDPSKFYVKPACVDLQKFNYDKGLIKVDPLPDLTNKIVGVYAGKIGGIYLENELFDFIAECYKHWGDNFRMLLLTSSPDNVVDAQLSRIALPKEIVIKKFVQYEAIPEHLAMADFAVNFMKPVPTRRYSAPIKDGEYWATGLAVVITKNISNDSDIISRNNAGYVLADLNKSEYINALIKISALLQESTIERKARIRAIAKKYRNFDIALNVYKDIYENVR